MGCKYVKEFEFGPSKVPVKAYMRGGAVRKAASKAEGGVKESKSMMKKEIAFMEKKGAPKAMIKHEKKEMASSKKDGYACGGSAAMKRGGKTKKSPAKKRSAAKEPKLTSQERQMAEGILSQMAAQAQQTGRMPGMPAGGVGGNARGFPPAPQDPMIPQQAPMMRRGGSKK
jgi:hypothetical protein